MILSEAISKMQATVTAATEKLEGNGFIISVATDYMNQWLRNVDDAAKAKYVTVSMVVATKDGKEGDEYCMSLGAMITRHGVDEEQLEKDISGFDKMVDEAVEVLAKYENKDEGHAYLTAVASEEYEKLLKKIDEEHQANRKRSMIINLAFIIGLALLLVISFIK